MLCIVLLLAVLCIVLLLAVLCIVLLLAVLCIVLLLSCALYCSSTFYALYCSSTCCALYCSSTCCALYCSSNYPLRLLYIFPHSLQKKYIRQRRWKTWRTLAGKMHDVGINRLVRYCYCSTYVFRYKQYSATVSVLA